MPQPGAETLLGSPTRPRQGDTAPGVWRVLGWAVALTLLLVQVWGLYVFTPGEGEPFFAGQDKVLHAILFGAPFALAILLRSRVLALIIVAHALISEPLQGILTPTRTVDAWDLVADLVGIALGLPLARALRGAGPRDTPGRLGQ